VVVSVSMKERWALMANTMLGSTRGIALHSYVKMYHRVKQMHAAITNAMTVLLRDLRRLMASMMLLITGNLAASPPPLPAVSQFLARAHTHASTHRLYTPIQA